MPTFALQSVSSMQLAAWQVQRAKQVGVGPGLMVHTFPQDQKIDPVTAVIMANETGVTFGSMPSGPLGQFGLKTNQLVRVVGAAWTSKWSWRRRVAPDCGGAT
ncbi:hypothetical protein NOR_00694 [Metarhizium rileyi]|uniref:Uncharacterized protein n=1 Tax=Metarhizium rileyi (strain RCEF 4871) TaxID=1649241 RepID=A0A167KRT1_METRR|nr:hypothetical protein NOR_00694 [Metarhizium rileyi RCEF 4871]